MASDSLIASLIKDVSEGLLVFRRLGFDLSDAQIDERARNIVTGLVNNYFVAMLGEGSGFVTLQQGADAPGTTRPLPSYRGAPIAPLVVNMEEEIERERAYGELHERVLLALGGERPEGTVPWHGGSCDCETCRAAKQKGRQS